MTAAQTSLLVRKTAIAMLNTASYGQELHPIAVLQTAKRLSIRTTEAEREEIWQAALAKVDPDEARAASFDDAEFVAASAY